LGYKCDKFSKTSFWQEKINNIPANIAAAKNTKVNFFVIFEQILIN